LSWPVFTAEPRSNFASGTRSAAKKEQRDWLLDRDACGPAFECILNSYHQRIQELRNWLH
jgi:uncharacterized protein